MNAAQHLEAARGFLIVAESGDAAREAYLRCADEILAAQTADPTLSQRKVADVLGRSQAWVSTLVHWRTSDQVHDRLPFANKVDRSAAATAQVVAARKPEDFANAFATAPPAARAKIAAKIAADPVVQKAVTAERTAAAERTLAGHGLTKREPDPVEVADDALVAVKGAMLALIPAYRRIVDATANLTTEDRENVRGTFATVTRWHELTATLLSGASIDDQLAELLHDH